MAEVRLVEGRLVSANEKLAELIDPEALEVAFRVSTAQYARLLDQGGRLMPRPVAAALDVSGVDLAAEGQITRDGALVGEGQSGRLIFAALAAAPGFKPGDFVTVSVEEPPLDGVVRLPASSFDAATGSVLALGDDDRLDLLPVTLVRRQGNDVLLRGNGPEGADLLAGRQVVIGRTPLLGPGIKVRPLQDSGAVADAPEPLVALSPERRARLVAFVEASARMPAEVKERVLGQLGADRVPAGLVARLESRIGG